MALAVVKDRIWPSLNYEPNPAQDEMHKALVRHRVSAWGRRAGKSTGGGHELIPEAFVTYFNREELLAKGVRREFWIVGPEYSDSEKEFRTFYNDCKRLKLPFDKPGTYYSARTGDMVVSLWDGLLIVKAHSAKHPENLVGEGLAGAIMAEAAKMKQSTWTRYVRPTLADFKGWSLWNSTPEGKNWFYEIWQQGNDPNRPDWWSRRFPSWVNPHVYPGGATDKGVNMLLEAKRERRAITPRLIAASGVDEEIVALLMDLTPEAFNQEIGALFTEFVGRVFSEWDEERHVVDIEYNPAWPCYGAVDYGWTNPFVWLMVQEDVWGNVYVIDEYYERQRDINDVAQDLLNHPYMGPQFRDRRVRQFFPDPSSPGDTEVLRKHLRVNPAPNTGGEIKHRLEAIRRFLKDQNQHLDIGHVDRKPRLVVNRRCVNFIREFDAYRYPETQMERKGHEPENPLKKDDHTPEALGRYFAGRGLIKSEVGTGAGAPKVRKARMGG